MNDEHSSSAGYSLDEILSEVRQFLGQERQLFGNHLLIEQHPAGARQTMSTRKQTETGDLSLFELPAPPRPPITLEPWGSAETIDQLNTQICNCTKCNLGHTRTRFVFGVGNPRATLMLVGEAPGADEDAQGEPFVGRAGQLLNKILEAINFRREEVYICNILKCRPPGNRAPQPDEVEKCIPYLRKQVDLIKPKLILCLGLVAAQNLLQTTEGLGKLRGRVLEYEGIPLMVTYHPAALLRNPAWKRPTWEDVQAVRKLHDELVAKG
jgi:uracil-DNA glycosylase family 4